MMGDADGSVLRGCVTMDGSDMKLTADSLYV